MLEITINNEDTINTLISKLDNPDYCRVARNSIKNYATLDSDGELFITTMAIAHAIKLLIPKKEYKNIIVKTLNEDDVECVAKQKKENSKYIHTFYAGNSKKMLSHQIDKFYDSVVAFGHELYHTKQLMNAENYVLDTETILFSLENVLLTIPGYYDTHFDELFFEKEAEAIGVITAAKFFKKYRDELDERKAVQTMLDRNIPGREQFEDEEQLKTYIQYLLKTIQKNSLMNDEKMFNNYPVLRYIYTIDGELQSPEYFENEMNIHNKEESKEIIEILKEISYNTYKGSSYK